MSTPSVTPRVLTVAALAGASFLVTTPAAAADTWTTTTVAVPSETVVEFGETIDIDVDLDSSSGDAPTQGTSRLLALRAGAWRPVATAAAPGDDFADVKPRSNTLYKVVYSGHTASTSGGDSYGSSESSEFRVSVGRRITHPRSGFVLKGRVTPRYGRKPIAIRVSRSQHSGFTKHRTIRTDARGRYRITLPRRDGVWYWRVKVRGNAQFIPSSYTWETRIFH